MGGVVIILATRGRLLRRQADHPGPRRPPRRCCCCSCSSGWALVGFLDDYIKIAKQRSLGLRSKAKMVGQTVVALVFGVLALSPCSRTTAASRPASQHISFIRDFESFALPTVVVVLLIWVIITAHQQRA